jgi:glycerol-3-phosphate acyltransferase PlsY
MGIWVGVVLLWKYSFGGALAAFGLFPIVALLFHRFWLFVLFACLVAILIWSKHTDNLVRLWMGTERRISDRPSDQVAHR